MLPSLDETLARSGARTKRVLEEHTRSQHAASHLWPEHDRIDTTGLTVEESLARAQRLIEHECTLGPPAVLPSPGDALPDVRLLVDGNQS